MMWKRIIKTRWIAMTFTVYALGGCVTNSQLADFSRSELARLAADVVGQTFALFLSAVNPFGAAVGGP